MLTTGKNTGTGKPVAYCLERTKGRIGDLFWGLLLIFFGFCVGVYGVTTAMEDRTGWGWEEYLKMGGGCLGGVALLAAGAWGSFAALRDVLQPGKSLLANSIRSQFPRPEEAPDWQELFAMVDQDLAANGRWFGKMGIGRDWMLGDEACALARVRGVFRHHEVRYRSSGGNRQIIELVVVDDRRQSQTTYFQDLRDMDAAIQYLRLRVPAATFDDYNALFRFRDSDDDTWDRMEREYQRRLDQVAQRAQAVPTPAGEGFVFTDAAGQRTSRVTKELLAQQMEAIAPGQQIVLVPTPPVAAGWKQMSLTVTEELTALNCYCREQGKVMVTAILKTNGSGASDQLRGFGLVDIPKAQALEVFTRFLASRQAPDVFGPGWQGVQVQAAPQQQQAQQPPYLNITDGTGVSRKYERFSRRDVELAAQKVGEGSYQSAILWMPPRLIFLDAGDKNDARTTIQIALPKDGAFRTFRERTTGRQAAEWFVGCLNGQLPQGFDRWKEVTKEWEKKAEKLEKKGGKK